MLTAKAAYRIVPIKLDLFVSRRDTNYSVRRPLEL
jgi:hypothetical protein